MSLCDALLLEPPQPNLGAPCQEVWIAALGSGAARGSGTQNDPFNGSTRTTPPLPVSLSNPDPQNPQEAVATASVPHTYANEEVVVISGATGPTADLWNGTFVIYGLTSTTFKYRMKDSPGSAAGGSPSSCAYRYPLDEIFRSAQENSSFHIGPGTFETRGRSHPNLNVAVPWGWYPKNGWRIRGVGMGLTTLKLVNAATANQSYSVVLAGGSLYPYLDSFEVSDLTCDCNVDSQLASEVNCTAIQVLAGRHIRIKRVRAINFGSKIPSAYIENFTFFVGTNPTIPESFDARFDGCIAERRCRNGCNNSTIFHMGGGENWDGFSAATAYHRGCAIRNCYADDQYWYGPEIPITGITCTQVNGIYEVTVTTAALHGYSVPGDVLVKDVRVQNGGENPYNGVFALKEAAGNTFKYNLVGEFPQAPNPPVASGTVGGGVSSMNIQVADNGIVPVPVPGSDTIYVLETLKPHNRTINDNVKVTGVKVTINGLATPSAVHNGTFKILSIESLFKIEYELRQAPEGLIDFAASAILIGNPSGAMSADNGTGAVVEGNRIFHSQGGGPYHDFWSTKDLLARENYYFDVLVGPQQNLGEPPPECARRTCKGLTHQGNIAKYITEESHGMTVGETVAVRNVPGDTGAFYNGYFVIETTGSIKENNQIDYFFTYRMHGDPGSDPSGISFVEFERVWQVGWWIAEENMVESAPKIYSAAYFPFGLYAGFGGSPIPANYPYCYLNLIFRGNYVSNAYFERGLDWTYHGIVAGSCRNALLDHNILKVDGDFRGVVCNNSESVKVFNNRMPSGKLLKLYNNGTGQISVEGLAQQIADALLMAI